MARVDVFFERLFCTYHAVLAERGRVHIALADGDVKHGGLFLGLAEDVLHAGDE